MQWEVDWSHPDNTGTKVMARNLGSHQKRAREWHAVTTGYLRDFGIQTATYRPDSWEVDWSCRNGKLVWARNLMSKMPKAREWHWIDFHTLERAGIQWKPAREKVGRAINKNGYVVLYRCGMSVEDEELAEAHGLFLGAKKTFALEHRLVALKKYGSLPKGTVVRHVNGKKDDNSPENLILGTTQENTADHDTARLLAMYWRERSMIAEMALGMVRSGAAIATVIEALNGGNHAEVS